MSILTDKQITTRCVDTTFSDNFRKPMIEPFFDHQVRYVNPITGGPLRFMPGTNPEDHGVPTKKIISFGLSSHGYDIRMQPKYKVFTNINSQLIDPMEMSDKCFVELEGPYCIIPPNSYILGLSVEKFCLPRDIMGICMGKSTYARCAAIVNVTPLEAGWEGHLVIEIANNSPLPLKVYADMGIAQIFFLQSSEECGVSYMDRGGKYNHQQGIQGALL